MVVWIVVWDCVEVGGENGVGWNVFFRLLDIKWLVAVLGSKKTSPSIWESV